MSEWQITYCEGRMPNQAEGVTPWGTPFYFRARHGCWGLYDCPTMAGEVDYFDWMADERCVAEGEHRCAGWWDPDEVLAFIVATITEPPA